MPHDDDYKCQQWKKENQKHNVMSRMLDHNTYPWAWSECSKHHLTEYLDLNMPHDDDYKCQQWKKENQKHNVMSRMLDHNTYPWAWSECSKHHLTEYLDIAGVQEVVVHDGQGRARGVSDATHALGRGDQVWGRDVVQTRGVHPEERGREARAWELGTLDAYRKRLGGWGDCSRNCGGGIKRSIRQCDSPTPKHGGKYCVGRRVRYQSCATEDCPDGTVNDDDFRAKQCADFNDSNFNIQGLPKNVQWTPKYSGIAPKDSCKLFCQVAGSTAYYLLQDKVIDGTPCGPDTNDICVNGICRAAGCDHVLRSNKKTDMCGVCGGDNTTCQVITGHFNDVEYGYNHVLLLPAGAANIDIRQHGYQGSNKDDNYLALRVPDPGDDYLLNGKFVVSMFAKTLKYGGTQIDYSGSGAVTERINSTGRPLHKDLVVEVLTVGNLYPPDIHYSYTISVSELTKYRRVLVGGWSDCSQVCDGIREKTVGCVRMPDRKPVPDLNCKDLPFPERPSEPCNTHCKLSWEVVHRSECSARCGPGFRRLTVKCTQIFQDFRDTLHDKHCVHLEHLKPRETEACEGACEDVHWRFSDWSDCSSSCNGGTQTRTAECVDELDRIVEAKLCNDSEKVVLRSCGNGDCPHWDVGNWTPKMLIELSYLE
ncbi:unnamed protein product [Notodromas monacha]|uniref:Uncharacterized protein n=1 Tax=Notodromas monacha TaxID=399045 RepID=A0A7R9BMV2_9CRUS|nr:unnamed protein product [Notodromas monacha]CAG0917323.1 unnamed protein product [Notodromas monacha]